ETSGPARDRIQKGLILNKRGCWHFTPPLDDTRLQGFQTKRARKISPKLSQPFGPSRLGIALKLALDGGFGYRWIHPAGVRLPDKHVLIILAVMLTVGVIQGARL